MAVMVFYKTIYELESSRHNLLSMYYVLSPSFHCWSLSFEQPNQGDRIFALMASILQVSKTLPDDHDVHKWVAEDLESLVVTIIIFILGIGERLQKYFICFVWKIEQRFAHCVYTPEV